MQRKREQAPADLAQPAIVERTERSEQALGGFGCRRRRWIQKRQLGDRSDARSVQREQSVRQIGAADFRRFELGPEIEIDGFNSRIEIIEQKN